MSEESGTQPIKLNFIRDEAADVDFFASTGEVGSHDRVATAVAAAIEENPDLKVIGLLGPWGSGKSTVVRLVEKHLEADDAPVRTHTFCFDAWLHQSDPPRRAFLEAFINFLIKRKLTTEVDRWTKQISVLNRQVEETETTSTPALTFSGRVLLLLLLLVPFGLQFVGHDWFDAAYGDKPSVTALWAFWLGLATVPVALLAAFIMYYRWRPVRRPWKMAFWSKDNWTGNRPPHEDDSLLSIFINRQVEKQKSRVVRTPDPTAIEFQRIFREIITSVSKPDRRIILVIDNLDRLNEVDAVALWGTIRSFFLGAEGHSDIPDAQLPTVILPVDQKALERMYEVQHDASIARTLVRSFMDKTFDLTFYVTPPVLSDWHDYLSAKMKSVFVSHLGDDWAFHVGRLYEKRHGESGAITPRDINVTINAIATLWLQWHGQGVSFVVVAYYIIFKDEIDGRIVAAVNNPAIDVSEFDPDWQAGLAAIHFGRAPQVAIQILIEPQLRRAIETNNSERFKVLAQERGFQGVFQHMLDASGGSEVSFTSKASLLVADLAPDPAPWVESAWRTLRRIWTTSVWRIVSKNEPLALKALLANCNDTMLATFIGRVARLLGGFDEALLSTGQNTLHFATMSREIVTTAQANNLKIPAIPVKGPPAIFLDVIVYAAGNLELNKAFTTDLDPDELVTALANLMQSKVDGNGAHLKLAALRAREDDVDWTPVLTAAREVVANRGIPFPGMLAAVNALGIFFSAGDEHRDRVRDLANSGALNSRIGEALGAKDYELMAKLTALVLLSETQLAEPGGQLWSSVIAAQPKFPELVDQHLRAYGAKATMHLAINAASEASTAALCKAIISHRVRQVNWGNMFVEKAIAQIDRYLGAMEPELHARFMNRFSTYESFWDEVGGADLTPNIQRILKLLSVESSDITKAVRQRGRKTLKAKLDAVTAPTWQDVIRSGEEPFPTAQVLAETQKAPLGLSSNLFDALTNLRTELVTNHPRPFGTRWFQAAKLLSLSAKRTLFANLRDHINGASDIPRLDELLKQGGSEFLTDGKFAEAGDGSVRHVILPLLDTVEGRTWLRDNADPLATWINASSDDTQGFLKDQVRHRWTNSDGPAREQLDGLVSAWGFGKLGGKTEGS